MLALVIAIVCFGAGIPQVAGGAQPPSDAAYIARIERFAIWAVLVTRVITTQTSDNAAYVRLLERYAASYSVVRALGVVPSLLEARCGSREYARCAAHRMRSVLMRLPSR